MKALTTYINHKNKWNAIFGDTKYELTTAQGRQQVAQSLECDLSPENLTCDGELVMTAQVQGKIRALKQAVAELKELDPTVKMYDFF